MKTRNQSGITRRDFVKGAGCVAVGVALGLPRIAMTNETTPTKTSRVVLIRHQAVVDSSGKIEATVIQQMLDEAVATLSGKDNAADGFASLFAADDVVGIKSNEWGPLPTPPELEQALVKRLTEVGIAPDKIDIADREVLQRKVFQEATALINCRPMRTHAWAGVGSLIKNYVMFVPDPYNYHKNSCASLAAIWQKPIVKDKTRLNVLVMLTPLFYGVGPHHFDKSFVWTYGGLIAGTDPVAVDTVGLRILQAKRQAHFGGAKLMKPTAHHIALADTEYGLGTADMDRIDLIRLGWQEDSLV